MFIKSRVSLVSRRAKAASRKLKVNNKANDIPTAIIFPNSITGFRSAKVKDKMAIDVVNAANKHGINIPINVFCSANFLFDSLLSENLTIICTVREIVSISNKAIKLDDTTLIFQSIKPNTPAVKVDVIKALVRGKNTNQMFPKNKYSIRAKIIATPIPNVTRSDFI